MPPKKQTDQEVEKTEVEASSEYLALQMEYDALKEEVGKSKELTKTLYDKISKLENELLYAKTSEVKGDCVYLGNKRYAVLRHCDGEQFVKEFKRKEIPRDSYCVALKKE